MREQLLKGASVGNRAPAIPNKLRERGEHQPQRRAVWRNDERTRPASGASNPNTAFAKSDDGVG
jgi:hypothetical protein